MFTNEFAVEKTDFLEGKPRTFRVMSEHFEIALLSARNVTSFGNSLIAKKYFKLLFKREIFLHFPSKTSSRGRHFRVFKIFSCKNKLIFKNWN